MPRPGDKKRWLALESNPDVMTSYLKNLGLDTSIFRFHDVLSTEDWALAMVSQPVLAVLFLFPVKDVSEAHRREEEARVKAEGQEVSGKVFWMVQEIGNACGTIGLLHAVGNNREALTFEKGSFLDAFFHEAEGKTPQEIAALLAADDRIDAAHGSAANEGQSEQTGEDVNTHFVCFVAKEGHLYELDGRKHAPINHGPSSPDTLLQDAVRVIKEFIARDPTELRFTIVALSPLADEQEDW